MLVLHEIGFILKEILEVKQRAMFYQHNFYFNLTDCSIIFTKQECIPVGCVPSAAAAVSRVGCFAGGGVLPGGCDSRRV